jgi:hypothetical protein
MIILHTYSCMNISILANEYILFISIINDSFSDFEIDLNYYRRINQTIVKSITEI